MEPRPNFEPEIKPVAAVCNRHGLEALRPLLESCRAFAREEAVNVAVLGRFKAGKSSCLNHLLGRDLLPVGVVPVTAVITSIAWGPQESAAVTFQDGHVEHVATDRVAEFVAEEQNPGNAKHVAGVRMETPAMEPFRSIRFVDTPGLESVLQHNTDMALEWLPNVGWALVAVSVDPPLSRQDIELIRSLRRFTPRISLLLTKADLLNESGRRQVMDFIKRQLEAQGCGNVGVHAYSVKPGFEHLRVALQQLLTATAATGVEHAVILRHKVGSLIGECAGYLKVALKAAEASASERELLRTHVLGDPESRAGVRLALRLTVRHATGGTRPAFEALLQGEDTQLHLRLAAEMEQQFPARRTSLNAALVGFETWVQDALTRELRALSSRHREQFLAPLRRTAAQLRQQLQDFRNRISERTLAAVGVTLATTELEFEARVPAAPDIFVGKVFDRNWELLSPVLPMGLIGGMVRAHFQRKLEYLALVNVARLVAQWEDAVNQELAELERKAVARLEDLERTLESVLAQAPDLAPQIRADLRELEDAEERLASE